VVDGGRGALRLVRWVGSGALTMGWARASVGGGAVDVFGQVNEALCMSGGVLGMGGAEAASRMDAWDGDEARCWMGCGLGQVGAGLSMVVVLVGWGVGSEGVRGV
jgi:hypothetical protein